MKELKEKLLEKLKKLSFEELLELLNKQNDAEIRGYILDTMQNEHEEKFIEWIG